MKLPPSPLLAQSFDGAPTLADALAHSRSKLAAQHPPAYVQSTVLAALAQRPAAPARGWQALGAHLEESVLGWVVAGGKVRQARITALALLLGVLAGGAAFVLGPMAHSGARAAAQVATSFMPLVGTERMANQDVGWVVATDIPRASLSSMGLPYDPARAADTVRAEMLMNPSGEVLAVRFIQ